MKIVAAGLGKRFNREWIFKNLSYEFEPGTYAVTGPNGSGKSTLLQVLWGQVPPSAGAVSYSHNGVDIAAEDIYQSLAIATSYMEVIEEFTLREMIAFHFSFKKIRFGKTADEVLEYMELAHADTKYISEFSSGMRQRLKLTLAMLSDTPVLFLDEPTTNLDVKSIGWYLKTLASLPAETIVIIASNQEHEYPASAKKVNILTYKQVTTSSF